MGEVRNLPQKWLDTLKETQHTTSSTNEADVRPAQYAQITNLIGAKFYCIHGIFGIGGANGVGIIGINGGAADNKSYIQ